MLSGKRYIKKKSDDGLIIGLLALALVLATLYALFGFIALYCLDYIFPQLAIEHDYYKSFAAGVIILLIE